MQEKAKKSALFNEEKKVKSAHEEHFLRLKV